MQLEIPWPQFANTMQKHFLRGTRQDAIRPTRCFSLEEFEYVHQKFFSSQPMITPKMFDNFWTWFGKTMQKLRYQRHILPLWQTGYATNQPPSPPPSLLCHYRCLRTRIYIYLCCVDCCTVCCLAKLFKNSCLRKSPEHSLYVSASAIQDCLLSHTSPTTPILRIEYVIAPHVIVPLHTNSQPCIDLVAPLSGPSRRYRNQEDTARLLGRPIGIAVASASDARGGRRGLPGADLPAIPEGRCLGAVLLEARLASTKCQWLR
jgi:hypothetical protein